MRTRLTFIILLFSLTVKAQDMFYYYMGNKIDLKIDRNYLNIANEDFQNHHETIARYFNIEQYNDKQSQNIIKMKFKSTPEDLEYKKVIEALRIKHIFPFFEKGDGISPVGTTDIFYLRLKATKDTILLQQIAQEQNVQVIKQVAYMPLWYVLSVQNSDFNNAIEASNYFYETGYFADVDPAFMFNFSPNCTNDPMFNQLWGLYNSANPNIDINACDAWAITRGAEIKIAVVDQGIYVTHNDLSTNIYPMSFDAQSGTSPSVFIPGKSHGTHVAGTVAAIRNNNLQVVGVAPESKIIGVSHNLQISPTISSELASGINWAWQNGADIITNSWGDQGGQFYNDLHSAILENAIINALTQGRNHKGCVVTFASGNYGVIDYPAYFDSRISTVGAIESNGSRAYFSGHGNELDIVAPGVNIVSTLPYNETGSYNGTSMACPHVAGVAALVLSANMNLTGQQVRNILESTAQKVGGYNYQTTSGYPNGTWNNEMGYGLVDAYAAVQTAISSCTSNFTNQTVTTNTTVVGCNNLNVQNVTVTNNAQLTLNAPIDVMINGTFDVQLGSSLNVQ